jgi:hypothetical protein
VTWDDCYAHDNVDYGFYVDDSNDTSSQHRFINCDAYNNGDDGFVIFATTDWSMTNCHSRNNSDHGLHVDDSILGKMSNCTVTGNTTHGLNYTNNVVSDYSKLQLSNCYFGQNTKSGMSCDGDRVSITGCVFEENTERGIRAYYNTPNDVEISGCRFRNNGLSGLELDNHSNWIITGSQFIDDQGTPTQNYGILENATKVGDVLITGCRFDGNQTGEASLQVATKVYSCIGVAEQ